MNLFEFLDATQVNVNVFATESEGKKVFDDILPSLYEDRTVCSISGVRNDSSLPFYIVKSVSEVSNHNRICYKKENLSELQNEWVFHFYNIDSY